LKKKWHYFVLLILAAINFVYVNGRLLYNIDWWMEVVEGGNVQHYVKREVELSGRGNVRGNMFRGEMYGSLTM